MFLVQMCENVDEWSRLSHVGRPQNTWLAGGWRGNPSRPAGCSGLVHRTEANCHAERFLQFLCCCPGLNLWMRSISLVDSGEQGGNKTARLPAKLVAFLHNCGEGNGDVPTKLGGMWAISCGGI